MDDKEKKKTWKVKTVCVCMFGGMEAGRLWIQIPSLFILLVSLCLTHSNNTLADSVTPQEAQQLRDEVSLSLSLFLRFVFI